MNHEVQPAEPAVSALPKRRWYQCSLKGMLVAMMLVGLPFAWLAYERIEVQKREVAIAAIKHLGGIVDLDEAQEFRPKWLLSMLGGKSVGEVVRVDFQGTEVTDADLEHLAGFMKLKALLLEGTQVTDAGLAHLARLKQLEILHLSETAVTSAGLAHIAGLRALRELSLSSNQVTDAGLVHLAGLESLHVLDLGGTQVTDTGLRHLTGLKQLSVLKVKGSKVTDQGLSRLQKALPNIGTRRKAE